MARLRTHYRNWGPDESYEMLKAIEFRLAPLGYHAAMIGSAKVHRPELEVVVFPDVKESDVETIKTCLYMTTLELRGIDTLEEPKKFGQADLHTVLTYEHGKGRNMRRARVFLQEAEKQETSEELAPAPTA